MMMLWAKYAGKSELAAPVFADCPERARFSTDR